MKVFIRSIENELIVNNTYEEYKYIEDQVTIEYTIVIGNLTLEGKYYKPDINDINVKEVKEEIKEKIREELGD